MRLRLAFTRAALATACLPWAALAVAAPAQRPNILWITSEDHGPHLGCYGDRYASTPNVDRLAARGVIYTHVWSCAPVCAPARTTLIAGMYANSTGGEHMRSMVPYPAGKQMYPQLLRSAGYYCTNNAKEDYNLEQPGQVWDDSSRAAHWKNRPAGKPFFAVFNSEKSHESQIRTRPHQWKHDPAQARVPAYHPDTPEVRQDWAQYHDGVSAADADAGRRLDELEAAGLADSTIVFYFADHGSGMPRSKRTPCDSGLHVPLVVYIPPAFEHLRPPGYRAGGKIERVVSFVDFAPTVLSLAGVRPPDWMQGHAFLGAHAGHEQTYAFGFRGRMDERYDLARSATDGRMVYVRNFMPRKIYGQHVAYMFETPTTRVWRQLHDERKLTPEQDAFWNAKPSEELYDLATDPDEVHNLAGSAEHRADLERFGRAVHDWMLEIRDVGLLPEGEMHERAAGGSPYDMAHDPARYPLERILTAAELASDLGNPALDRLSAALDDADSAVRYWGALGLQMRGGDAVRQTHGRLARALADKSPYVRVAAAQALATDGDAAERQEALAVLSDLADPNKRDVFVVVAALNALDDLGPDGAKIKETLRDHKQTATIPHARYGTYIPRLLEPVQEAAGR